MLFDKANHIWTPASFERRIPARVCLQAIVLSTPWRHQAAIVECHKPRNTLMDGWDATATIPKSRRVCSRSTQARCNYLSSHHWRALYHQCQNSGLGFHSSLLFSTMNLYQDSLGCFTRGALLLLFCVYGEVNIFFSFICFFFFSRICLSDSGRHGAVRGWWGLLITRCCLLSSFTFSREFLPGHTIASTSVRMSAAKMRRSYCILVCVFGVCQLRT